MSFPSRRYQTLGASELLAYSSIRAVFPYPEGALRIISFLPERLSFCTSPSLGRKYSAGSGLMVFAFLRILFIFDTLPQISTIYFILQPRKNPVNSPGANDMFLCPNHILPTGPA